MELQIDQASAAWDVLAQHVEAFLGQWEEQAEPPRLDEHLPPEPAELRRLTLIELVKVDLEYRWQRERPARRIEEYIAEFPELLEEGQAPCELIYEEYHVRRSAGDDVGSQEYYDRFPTQAEALRRLMGLNEPTITLSLHGTTTRRVDADAGDSVDDFDLLLELGRGAFATVFLARQKSMQRVVALKVSADQGAEPQTLAQLDHAGIVRVFDQRVLAERRMRLLYMEFVAAGTLQNVVTRLRGVPPQQRGRKLLECLDAELARVGQAAPSDSPARRLLAATSWPAIVCRMGARLAQALDYAHRRGVLHRDVKPANILLTGDGTPKLVDFNISFCSQLDGATPAAYFGGSLAYMSPEQLEACNPHHKRDVAELDERGDIFSLGVVLWELLLGQRPFRDGSLGGGWSAMLEAMAFRRREGQIEEEPTAPHNACHAQLVQVLKKCMAPEPDERFASGDELARELLLCLHPRARRLMQKPSCGVRRWVARFPLVAVLLVALAPNALAGWFNYAYNKSAIIEQRPDAQRAFWNVQLAINSIAFPAGAIIACALAWPVAAAMRKQIKGTGLISGGEDGVSAGSRHTDNVDSREDGRKLDLSPLSAPDHGARIRRRALALGHYAALVGVALWVGAGPAYPVSLRVLEAQLQPIDYLHFCASLALCGLIAAAYPFFGVTWISVRVLYPALLRGQSAVEQDDATLSRLGRSAGLYLLVAGGVPLLGVALLVLSAQATQVQNPAALGVLSIAGLAGFSIAYLLYVVIQRDLSALRIVVAGLDAESGER